MVDRQIIEHPRRISLFLVSNEQSTPTYRLKLLFHLRLRVVREPQDDISGYTINCFPKSVDIFSDLREGTNFTLTLAFNKRKMETLSWVYVPLLCWFLK